MRSSTIIALVAAAAAAAGPALAAPTADSSEYSDVDASGAITLSTLSTIAGFAAPLISSVIDHFKNRGNQKQRRDALELESIFARAADSDWQGLFARAAELHARAPRPPSRPLTLKPGAPRPAAPLPPRPAPNAPRDEEFVARAFGGAHRPVGRPRPPVPAAPAPRPGVNRPRDEAIELFARAFDMALEARSLNELD